jgi:hypothetical protein
LDTASLLMVITQRASERFTIYPYRLSSPQRAEDVRRVALEVVVLEQEAEEALERGDVRAWLPGAGRRVASSARKARRSGGRTRRRASMPRSPRNVTQARTSRS